MALTWVVAILCIVASATVWCSASASSGEIGARRRSWRSESYRQARLLIAPLLFSSHSVPLILAASPSLQKLSKMSLSGQLVIGGCLRGNRGCTRRRRFSHGTLTRPAKVCMRAVCGRASCPPTDPSQHNVQRVCLLAVSKSWPRCGHVRDRSRDRCARRSAHNRRHAAGDSHTARPGPSLRNVRRSIRTCLADHHPVGRQRNGGP